MYMAKRDKQEGCRFGGGLELYPCREVRRCKKGDKKRHWYREKLGMRISIVDSFELPEPTNRTLSVPSIRRPERLRPRIFPLNLIRR